MTRLPAPVDALRLLEAGVEQAVVSTTCAPIRGRSREDATHRLAVTPRLLLASLLMLVTAPTPAQDPHAEQLVRSVQRQLVEKGFAPGWPDGHWNPHTEAALADFQRTAGLPPTGTPDPATLSALFAPAEIERTRGVEPPPPPARLPVQSFGLGAAIGFLAATVLALIVFVRRPQSAE